MESSGVEKYTSPQLQLHIHPDQDRLCCLGDESTSETLGAPVGLSGSCEEGGTSYLGTKQRSSKSD